MTIWRAGMKAVCIDGGGWFNKHQWWRFKWHTRQAGPQKGDVCTVRTVFLDARGQVYLTFVEWPATQGHRHDNFRPVTDTYQKAENVHFKKLRDLLKTPAPAKPERVS